MVAIKRAFRALGTLAWWILSLCGALPRHCTALRHPGTSRRPGRPRYPGDRRDPSAPPTPRDPGERRDPFGALSTPTCSTVARRFNRFTVAWIPAFAGMTKYGGWIKCAGMTKNAGNTKYGRCAKYVSWTNYRGLTKWTRRTRPSNNKATRSAFATARVITLAMLIVTCGSVHAAAITVSVEPGQPTANESFQLIFRSDSKVDAEPDFSELESVVDILGRNRQTSIQWINGRNSHTTTWILEVMANAPGRLVIPEIAFGSDRSSQTIVEIQTRGNRNPTTADTGLFLEIEVDNTTPYVQEQIILTARLLRRVQLNDANLTDPSADADVIIKRLGKDTTTQTMRDNKRYEVFERRFSIFPQTSGPVTINPMTLTTQVVNSSRLLFDPFRQSVKTRRIESNQISLEVKPIPPSFTGDTWLPAKRLSLRDDWAPDSDRLTAGEPLTRTVFLWADGLNAGQLPELPIALPDGLKIYPDQPQTSEQESDTGFSAIRQQKFAIIPNTASKIIFPPVSITWWNTQTDQQEIARLDERPFTVERVALDEPPAGETADLSSPPTAAEAPIDLPSIDAAGANGMGRNIWFILACVCLIGWLATLLAWWFRSRSAEVAITPDANASPTPGLARARRDVLGACKAKDPAGTKNALIAWGRVAFNDPQLMTLGEVAHVVAEPLDTEIRLLDEYLYGQNRTQWDQFALQEAFEHSDYRAKSTGEMKQTVNPLPDLYRLSGS